MCVCACVHVWCNHSWPIYNPFAYWLCTLLTSQQEATFTIMSVKCAIYGLEMEQQNQCMGMGWSDHTGTGGRGGSVHMHSHFPPDYYRGTQVIARAASGPLFPCSNRLPFAEPTYRWSLILIRAVTPTMSVPSTHPAHHVFPPLWTLSGFSWSAQFFHLF